MPTMALLLSSPFVSGFSAAPMGLTPRSGYNPKCSEGKNVCTMADGVTCGKYIGVGGYSGDAGDDTGFCYYKKNNGHSCDYSRGSCVESGNDESSICRSYQESVQTKLQCPAVDGQGGQATYDSQVTYDTVDPCLTGKYVCTMADGSTCGKYIGVGEHSGGAGDDNGFCYYKKNVGGSCAYSRESCIESGNDQSSICRSYQESVDVKLQCPDVD